MSSHTIVITSVGSKKGTYCAEILGVISICLFFRNQHGGHLVDGTTS